MTNYVTASGRASQAPTHLIKEMGDEVALTASNKIINLLYLNSTMSMNTVVLVQALAQESQQLIN